MAWLGQYARLVARYWWALVIGGVFTVAGVVGTVLEADESWLAWTVAGLLFFVFAQVLLARKLMRPQPPQVQVTHNHFAAGSRPTFTVRDGVVQSTPDESSTASEPSEADSPDQEGTA